jgi:hypothetical protein
MTVLHRGIPQKDVSSHKFPECSGEHHNGGKVFRGLPAEKTRCEEGVRKNLTHR